MPTAPSLTALLLALAPLALSLPQQQSAQTAQAVNPINGLAIPAASSAASAGSASDSESDSDATPAVTALSQPSSSPQASSASDSDSEDISTITAPASLPSDTAAASSSEEPPNTDPNILIWTDTAQNTVVTMTRSTTSFIPIPTMQVPPGSSDVDVVTATVEGADGKPTPTHDVDTFVQGYTGGAASGRWSWGGGEGRVWWMLGVAAVMGVVL
ncbi:uncharacterized protein HMPREF1541_04984 [Cyphellophora europaea CBS 101466]|uniref:REJ domain-containing protein n=1 Tax=Cyphellophora europaea (strain CBS 101466) TaxID=1220924 RepID=W2RWK4_CYPE1|nr:uncharacterized protein HMPREF1541_04984 [Cyphellophora europaea CBS 101466]ETN40705.1 hypothetical protein HMPREF1541_04984 [Cyphellophora europaea CBS 101466]